MTVAPSSNPSSPEQELHIFLTDDHPFVRDGIRTLVNNEQGMRIVEDASDGVDTLRRLRSRASQGVLPDIVVMDVSMPGRSGAETTTQIKKNWSAVKVIALSMHEEKSYLRAMLEAGASSYILKRSAAAVLIQAIRTVASGQTYIDPALTTSLVQSFIGGKSAKTGKQGSTLGAELSEREDAVLRLIAQGFANKEIAIQIDVSIKTVETYKARSMQKMGLDSRADIVRYALAQGWLK